MDSKKLNLVILSLGDPGGISAEILLKILNDSEIKKSVFCDKNIKILIIGSKDVLLKFSKLYNIEFQFKCEKNFKNLKNYEYLNNIFNKENIIVYDPYYDRSENCVRTESIANNKNFLELIKIGDISYYNGYFAEKYLYKSVNLIKWYLQNQFNTKINIYLLTLPVNKKSISLVKKGFIGHTEYIAEFFNIKNVTMTMHSDKITVALVSTHIPLFKLKKYVNKKKLEFTLKNAVDFYYKMGFENGIGVLGLNPHASDHGIIGNQERWISQIIEQMNKLLKNGIYLKDGIKLLKKEKLIYGPIPSDTAFATYNTNKYSIYIAFYHDQGLIPFKLLSDGKGTNITYGLPFLRISPDHGTGFDIVGKNIAKIDSLKKCFNIIVNFTK